MGIITVDGIPFPIEIEGETPTAEEAERIRASRDTLLAETDYLGLSDVTMSSAMITYRQALRDVPQQTDFPSTISWPIKP